MLHLPVIVSIDLCCVPPHRRIRLTVCTHYNDGKARGTVAGALGGKSARDGDGEEEEAEPVEEESPTVGCWAKRIIDSHRRSLQYNSAAHRSDRALHS